MRASETSQNSLNSSMEENRKHMQSLDSALNRVKASGQELAFAIGEGGLRDAMYSVLTTTATFIKGFKESLPYLTNWGTAIGVASVALTGFIPRVAATIPLLGSLAAGIRGVGAAILALASNPIGLLLTAVAGLGTAFVYNLGKNKEFQEELQKLGQAADQSNQKLKQIEETLNSIGGTKKQDILDYDKTIENLEKVKNKLDELVKAEQDYVNHAKDLDPNFSFNANDISLDPDKIDQEFKDLAQSAGINILQFNTLGEAIEAVKNKLAAMSETSKRLKENDLTSYIEENGEKIKILTSLLDDAKNGLELNQGALQRLSDLGIDYSQILEEQNGKIGLNIAKTNELTNAFQNAVNSRIAALEREIKAEESSLLAFLASMNIKISKIEEFNLINGQLTDTLNKQAKAGNVDALRFAGGAIARSAGVVQKAKADLLEYKALFQSLKSEGKLGSGEVKKKKSSSPTTEYAPMTEENKKLIQAENELARIRQEQSKWAEHSVQYRQSLSDERKELEKIISLKEKELATVQKTNKIGGKSNKIGGSIKDSDEAFKKVEDLRKEIDDLKNQLSEVATKEEKSLLAGYVEDIQKLDSALQENQSTLENLSTISQEYRNGLDTDIQLLEAKQLTYQNEVAYLEKLIKLYGEHSAKGKEYKDTLQDRKKALEDVNKALGDKRLSKFNSVLDANQDIINSLNNELEDSKNHMSSLTEGNARWSAEVAKQNEIIKTQRALNAINIIQLKQQIATEKDGSATKQQLIQKLRELEAAQNGYNQALKETSFLQAKVAQSEKEWAEAKERAQEIKDEIMDALSKVLDSIQLEVEIDPESLKDGLNNALAELKNLNGEFLISDDIESLDSLKEVENAINEYVSDLAQIQKKTQELIKLDRSFQDENLTAIEKEAKFAEKIKKELKETTELLNQKKFQYQQIEKSLEYQIKLLEEERDKVLEGLRDQMEVTPDFSIGQFKDDLVELLASQGISLSGIGIDLSDATVIGDVSSDIRTIVGDILSDNSNISSITGEFEKQNAILERQSRLREELLRLEKEGKENTKEYKKLKWDVFVAERQANQARQKMQNLIEQEIGQLNDLREEEKRIRDEIQERETLYQQQVKAIEDQIESTNRLYDQQIKQQQDKLKLLDEQIEREDRLIERTRLLQELENVKKDKRFEYINEQGQVELTYDKAKVAELEQQLADFDRENARKDQRKQLEDEIERLEEARDSEIERLEQYQEILKQTHDKEIAQLNFYLNQNKVLQDKLVYNINNHIAQLEQSYNTEIEFENNRLERLKALHEAEIQAMEAYIEGLNTQLDKIEEDVGKRIDKIGKVLEDFVNNMEDSALDWQTIIDRLKGLVTEIGNIKITVPEVVTSPSAPTPPNPDRGDHRRDKYHDGGFVGGKSPSRIATLANRIFNGSIGSERDVTSLVGELQIPPKNLGDRFKDNMRRILSHVTTNNNQQSVSKDTHYHINVEKVVAQNPIEFMKNLGMYTTQATSR